VGGVRGGGGCIKLDMGRVLVCSCVLKPSVKICIYINTYPKIRTEV